MIPAVETARAGDQVFGAGALGEALENEFHRDPGAAEDRLSEHHSRHPFDVLLPVHRKSVSCDPSDAGTFSLQGRGIRAREVLPVCRCRGTFATGVILKYISA